MLDTVPQKHQAEVKAALQQIASADTERAATARPDTFARTYRRSIRKPSSDSSAQRPDIATEIKHTGGKSEILIFDPKYKVDGPLDGTPESLQPVKPDIDKMHAYRDAIRDSDGHRAVSLAATLYPGPSFHFDPGIAALSARPNNKTQLTIELMTLIRAALR